MKQFITFVAASLLSASAYGQLAIKDDGLTIVSGTTFYVAGLILTPSSDLTITNDTLRVSTSPATGANGAESILKSFQLTKPFTYSGVLSIKYSSDELNGNTPAAMNIAIGTDGRYQPVAGSSQTMEGGDYVVSYTLSNANANSFTATSANVVLPINWSSFKASAVTNCSVLVQWNGDPSPATSVVVERSANARVWQPISGSINRSQGDNYSFVDVQPLEGANFYRLVEYSADQRKTYSSIVRVDNVCKMNTLFSVAPNPVANEMTVKLSGDIKPDSRVTIADVNGKVLQSHLVTATQFTLQLQQLPAGIYLVTYADDVRKETIKVVRY